MSFKSLPLYPPQSSSPRRADEARKFSITAFRQPVTKRKTAQQYLSAVKGLIQYWRAQSNNDPLFINQAAEMDGIRRKRRQPGSLHITWYAPIPSALWRIRIPIEERHDLRHYKGLSRDDCQKVMTIVNRAARRTKMETMLFYRDRAIWTFLLMSGLRKGENDILL